MDFFANLGFPSPKVRHGLLQEATADSHFLFGSEFLITNGNTWDLNHFYCCNNRLQCLSSLDSLLITEC